MAQEWCVAYGVLDDEKARKVDKIICTRKGTKPSQSPKKVSSSSSSSSSNANSVKEKEKEKAKPKGAVQSSKKARYDEDIIVDTGLCLFVFASVYLLFISILNCCLFVSFVV
jgi:hypothetical protein